MKCIDICTSTCNVRFGAVSTDGGHAPPVPCRLDGVCKDRLCPTVDLEEDGRVLDTALKLQLCCFLLTQLTPLLPFHCSKAQSCILIVLHHKDKYGLWFSSTVYVEIFVGVYFVKS